jgi:hypothetical protein
MKRLILSLALLCASFAVRAAQTDDPIGTAVENYFNAAFERLGKVAAQKPTVETFRKAMKPCAEATNGFFGGTLIDTDYVIRQTYLKKNFLAKGFSLRKVKQLDYFWEQMDKNPAPQLSEPGHGSLIQPRLIAMRYPVITDGKLVNVVSMMVRTESFLEATGLDKCSAFKIICRGEPAEEKGTLSENFHEVKLALPSTDWVIQYDL